MDLCFIRVYSKLYISQILNSMNYIENNNVNCCLENEVEEFLLEEENKNNKDNNDNENNDFNKIEIIINNEENPYKNAKEINNSSNNDKNNKEIEEEELQDNENTKINSNNCLEINKKIFNETEKEKKLFEEEDDNFITNNVKENKTKRRYEFIPPTEENINKYKRMFVFKNNVYSKVEIQGLIVEKKTFQKEDNQKSRHVLRIDDSTGTIQITSWRSKNENLYIKIRDFLVK